MVINRNLGYLGKFLNRFLFSEEKNHIVDSRI